MSDGIEPFEDELFGFLPDLAQAHRQQVRRQPDRDGSDFDRDGQGSAPSGIDDSDLLLTESPEQLSWFDLERNTGDNPATVAAAWDRLRLAAERGIRTGHGAARVLETRGSTPFDRAEFLAIRFAFVAQFAPIGPGEGLLIDMLTQQWMLHRHWVREACLGHEREQLSSRAPGPSRPWREVLVDQFDRTERAMVQAERCQKMFLRTQKALVEGRRVATSFFVANAGQVNVGQQRVIISAESDAGVVGRR